MADDIPIYKCEIEVIEMKNQKEVGKLKDKIKKLEKENKSLKSEIEILKNKSCDDLPKKRKKIVG